MRILHLTDTHLGAHLSVLGAPAGWSRAEDHALAMREALRPAMEQSVDLVLHTGDLFDRSQPPPSAMVVAAELLAEAARRVPVLVMPGNHDRNGLTRSLPLGAPGLRVCDRPERVVIGGLSLAVVPWQRGADTWAAAARAAVGEGVDLMLAHQAFDGASAPNIVFRVGEQRDTVGEAHLPRGVRWVLCGHLHPRQLTRVGGAEVVQPGATERTAFSEAPQTKGYAVWELERRVRWRFVDLPTRPMRRAHHPDQLRGLAPGTLVRGELAPELVMEAGGWPVVRPSAKPASPPSPQLGLFGRQLRLG